MIRLGLIGRKLGHSYSRDLFMARFAALGIEGVYALYEMESIESVREIVRRDRLDGFNVTIPYKESIIPMLDLMDSEALAIGAVNTVAVSRDMTLTGYNTDIYGFDAMLTEAAYAHWGCLPVDGCSAVVLGSGGAAKAVVHVLTRHNVGVTVVSRTVVPRSWTEAAGCRQTTYTQLDSSTLRNADIIVNATPVGMYPDTEQVPAIDYSALSPKTIALDLIYNPAETQFMRLCRKRGAYTDNGRLMLEVQADEAWRIWTAAT